MEDKDYYKILGVSREASQEEIKRAYRKLARKYHPDVSKEPDAEARFKEINEAHEVLKDPEKRAAYDALGNQWQAGQEFRPPPGGFHQEFRHGEEEVDLGRFSDFFASLFGSGLGGFSGNFRQSGQRASRRGQDQTARVELSLEEAYQGTTRTLRLETPQQDAQGQIRSQLRTLRVRIPPGVSEGRQIRLAGQGLPGIGGGPAGDLYLQVHLQPHPFFQVDGRDVLLRLPITPWEAALGATVQVPTLGGAVSLRVPAGSQSGKRMRLKGRGLPGNPAGDQYVTLEIRTPAATTEAQKECYRRMETLFDFHPRAKLGVH